MEPLGEDRYRCRNKGITITTTVLPIHCCRPADAPPPGTIKRAGLYARAVARWIKAGRPTRSEEEVQRLFEEYCSPCERYSATRKTCQTCGCRVASQGIAVKNKIAMLTEHCPLRKW
jgi:hypothetical protein